ncbi:hypothetical protein BGW41_006386 [Actinomortierella wolfii]|nr:hypothetical protein BGW41_006386 [Actinomortierella wolfii]
MFSRIAARCIHIAMLTLAALTAGCIYAYNSGLAAFESFLWIVQSRIYENGRPSVQEIVLSLIFSAAYLFSAAWQFYHAYSDSSASGFLCSTDGRDELIDCRLWQAGLVGSAACGFAFLFIALLWTYLFRRRHNIPEDLPGDLTPEITSDYVKEGNATSREEAAAIAAEAERRQKLHRQQQQQDHRQMTLPSVGHTPTPPANHGYPSRQNTQFSQVPVYAQARPSHDSVQENYYNPAYYATTQPYQQPMAAYQHQQYTPTGYPNAHYGGNMAYNGNTTPMTQDYGRSGTPVNGVGLGQQQPYTEEPTSYFDASQYYGVQETGNPYSTSNVALGYANGVNEGGVQAHRDYANQLKQQQSYHENMAEALQRQAQSQRDGLHSGSTAPAYPPPPHSRSSIGVVSNLGNGGGLVSSKSGDTNYSGRQGTMPVHGSSSRTNMTPTDGIAGVMAGDRSRTPSSPGSARPANSPQQYHPDDQSQSDVATSGYADDNRYRDELLEEIRRQRQGEFEGRQGDSGTQDYKVPIV